MTAISCFIEKEKGKCELPEPTGEMAAVVSSGNNNEDGRDEDELHEKEGYDQDMKEDNEKSKKTNANCFMEKDEEKCKLSEPILEMTAVCKSESNVRNEDDPDEKDLNEKVGHDLDIKEEVEKSQMIVGSLQTVSSLLEKDEGKCKVPETTIKAVVKFENSVHNEGGQDENKLSDEEGYDQDMKEDSDSDYSPIPALSSPNDRDLNFFSRMREEELEFSPAKYSQLEDEEQG